MGYCQNEAKSRFATLCENHYARKRRGRVDWDQPSQYEKTPEQRFWEKVDKRGGFVDFTDPLVRVTEADGECWVWTGGHCKSYGVFVVRGKTLKAYNFSLTLAGVDLDDDLTSDHLCRNKSCVRPNHLERVSAGVNSLRSGNIAAVNARKTHCKRGHELTPENVYQNKAGRCCIQCNKDGARERRENRTHCSNGHELTPENTVLGSDGRRLCLICKATFGARLRARFDIAA